MDDLKRKAKWYLADFKDALHLQSVASIIFLYFASMTPLVTFGGLMSSLLKGRMVRHCPVTSFTSSLLHSSTSTLPFFLLVDRVQWKRFWAEPFLESLGDSRLVSHLSFSAALDPFWSLRLSSSISASEFGLLITSQILRKKLLIIN
jgi:HCO3- transporter family